MAKVSELISKYLVSLFDGKVEGVVENVLFDERTSRAKYFVVYDNDSEEKYVLPISAIYSIGSGAISIKNNSYLTLYSNLEMELKKLCTPVNNNAFMVNGDYLGVVLDCELDEKYFIKNLTLNTGQTINILQLASFNNNTIIIYDKENKVNIKNFYSKKKITNKKDTRVVSILQIKDEQTDKASKIKPAIVLPTQIPNRAVTNYNFLINRKVKKSITSFSGDVIIKQNTKINSSVIDVARNNGKLSELTKYSS